MTATKTPAETGTACCGGHHHATHEPEAVTRDPVCGMTVDPQAGKPSHAHGGRLFHFCSAGCRDRFAAQPDEYLTARDPVCA